MSQAMLSFEHVTARYHHHREPALEDISFSILPGERVALFGLNGSGKTTLLLSAVGLVGVEGTITVNGMTVEKKALADVRSNIGYLFNVPEDQLLFPRVIDDVAFTLLRRGVPRAKAKQRALASLARLDADSFANLPPHELSHGQRLRVALAGALVGDPPLLLLDEPSAALDPPAKKRLAQHLDDFPAAMLVATHDIAFARRFCRRYVMLDRGRIVKQGESFDEVEAYWDAME